MPNQVKSWSYSRISDYRTCPARFNFKHNLRIKEPESPAMIRGGAVDEAVTAYLNGAKRTLPPEKKYGLNYGPLKLRLTQLKKAGALTQLEYAVDRNWEPCDWKDWDRAWLRAKLDIGLITGTTALVIDNKTGKVYADKHAEQLEIYAAVTWAQHPQVTEIEAQMFYLDQGVASAPALFTDLKKTIPRLRKKWERIAKPLFTDTKWKATPGSHCSWCPYSGRKGGPCKAG